MMMRKQIRNHQRTFNRVGDKPMRDTSKQHEGELSPKNPSLQLVLYTGIGVAVILLIAASSYYGLIRF